MGLYSQGSFQTYHFYPRPPRGGRHTRASSDTSALPFLPTPSARRATEVMDMFPYGSQISTHALREEGDDNAWCRTPAHCHFYPRPPRGGRPRLTTISMPFCKISTHALREEGDELCFCVGNALVTFLPTPSARRATRWKPKNPEAERQFLPTPSARRATVKSWKPITNM